MTVDQVLGLYMEADHEYDGGEFSGTHDYYEGFCQCEVDEDMFDQPMPDCIDPRATKQFEEKSHASDG